MKASKFIVWISALILAATIQTFAQKDLPEVVVRAANYKYLNAVDTREVAAQPVSMLERYAAAYDVKSAEFYEEENDNYFVSFFIPEGKILAAYDKDGNILRTTERFKNVALPKAIMEEVAERYPKWAIAKDVYAVNYFNDGTTTKVYKLLLEKGDQRMRVKMNERGEFQ
jgi:hypothetical protein